MRRVLGVILIVVGLFGIVISIGGIILGLQIVDNASSGIISSLDLTLDSLDTVVETLELSKTTVAQMEEGLVTVEETADNVSVTVNQTRPLLDQISNVASEDVPNSLEAFQGTVPGLVEVAGIIDETLTTLSNLRVQRDLGLFNLDFDLGVEYEPTVPFDESVSMLGSSLEGLPEQLRTLDIYIAVTSENLQTISRNVSDLAENVSEINSSVAEINPLLDEYIVTVQEIQTSLRNLRMSLAVQLQSIRIGLVVVFVWLALNQIVPIYLGVDLLRSERRHRAPQTEVEEAA